MKRRLSVPVVFNGDIIDVASAREAFEYTGCDAVMIGRGAVRNPWVFREIRHELFGGPPIVVDATEERVLLGYFADILERFRSAKGALGRWKKIMRYFSDGLPYGDRLKLRVFRSQTIEEARDHVRGYFDDLRELESGRSNPFEQAARLAG